MTGRRATAPCGHPGEAVFGSFVNCLTPGCDGKPAAAVAVAPGSPERGRDGRRLLASMVLAKEEYKAEILRQLRYAVTLEHLDSVYCKFRTLLAHGALRQGDCVFADADGKRFSYYRLKDDGEALLEVTELA